MYDFLNSFRSVKIKKIHDKCITPYKANLFAAGIDICACLDEDIDIMPFERVLVPTGFCMELQSDTEAQIRPRSGLANKHGITVLNSPGTIDMDFRGEVKVLLINLGNEKFTIKHGMRIAQMVVASVPCVSVVEVEKLCDTTRGDGGFGSTGV